MSEEINVAAAIAEGLASPDKAVRAKAAAYQAWTKAEAALTVAEAELATEEARLGGRQTDLENDISAQQKGADPVIQQKRQDIVAAEKRIADLEAQVEAARVKLAEETAQHETTLAGLRATVAATKAAAARAEGNR